MLFLSSLSLCCDQQKSIILFVFPLLSPLYPSLLFSPSFILSLSYHIIGHLKSIHFMSFSPLSSFLLSSAILFSHTCRFPLQKHLGVKGISVAIPQLFKHAHTHVHAHIHWHSVTLLQCKIYGDVISADRAIDSRQYSRDRNDSPSSLSLCMCASVQHLTKVVHDVRVWMKTGILLNKYLTSKIGISNYIVSNTVYTYHALCKEKQLTEQRCSVSWHNN